MKEEPRDAGLETIMSSNQRPDCEIRNKIEGAFRHPDQGREQSEILEFS
jgi:hypothetical protein